MPLTNPSKIIVSAGTTSNSLPAVTFSNSNNVSFGLNGSTITASASYSQSTGPGGIAAGGATATSGTVIFSNSNGLAFGLNGQTITGSYSVPTQTNQTVGLYGLGNTTQNSSTTLDARSLSFNGLGAATVGYSNGSIQFSVPVQTAQTQSNIQAVYDGANSISTGTLRFTNANGVSFTINGQTISGSVAAQTNQSIGLYALGNTTQNSSTTLDARTLSFNGLGAATVGYSNGSIQISVPVQTAQTQSNIQAIYDGAASISTGTIRFSNLNNVSFGINGQTITASVSAQSVQTIGLYALGNTTQNSSTTLDARTLSFNGLGAVTVGYSNNSIQISVPVQTAQTQSNIQGIYDGANSITTGTIRFTNANGVSFTINGQTISGSVAAQTNQSIGIYAVSNTTQSSSGTVDARSLSFQGAGIASVGWTNGSVVISVPTGAPSPVNFSAGTTSGNLGSVVFADSNGVSFGLNGATITASANGGGGAQSLYALGNTTQNSSTTLNSLSFNALGAMTMGYSNGSIQVSAPPVSSLSATGLLSISTNGSTISIGAAERTWSNWEPYPLAIMMTGSSTSAHNTGSAWFDRVVLPTAVAIKNANFVKTMGVSVPAGTAGATSGVVRVSYQQILTIFSRQNFGTGSTNLSYMTSASFGFTAGLSFTSVSQTASISWVSNSTGGTTSFSTTSNAGNWSSFWTGMKMWQIPLVTTLSAGEYFFANAQSSTTASTNTGGVLFNTLGNVCFLGQRSAFSVGTITSAGIFTGSNYIGAGVGIISTGGIVTTTTMAMSGISFVTNASMNAWYFNLSNA